MKKGRKKVELFSMGVSVLMTLNALVVAEGQRGYLVAVEPTPEEMKRLESEPAFRDFQKTFREATGFPAILPEIKTEGLPADLPTETNSSEVIPSGVTEKNLSPGIFPIGSLPPEKSATGTVAPDETTSEIVAAPKRIAEKISLLRLSLFDTASHRGEVGRRAFRPFRFGVGPNGDSLLIWEAEGGKGEEISVFDFSPGALVRTDRETDAAIVGPGFFRVTEENGGETFLTRAGNFGRDSRGFYLTRRQKETKTSENDLAEETSDVSFVEPAKYYLDPPREFLADAVLFDVSRPDGLESADGVFFRPTEKSGEATEIRRQGGVGDGMGDSGDSSPVKPESASSPLVGCLELANGEEEAIRREIRLLSDLTKE